MAKNPYIESVDAAIAHLGYDTSNLYEAHQLGVIDDCLFLDGNKLALLNNYNNIPEEKYNRNYFARISYDINSLCGKGQTWGPFSNHELTETFDEVAGETYVRRLFSLHYFSIYKDEKHITEQRYVHFKRMFEDVLNMPKPIGLVMFTILGTVLNKPFVLFQFEKYDKGVAIDAYDYILVSSDKRDFEKNISYIRLLFTFSSEQLNTIYQSCYDTPITVADFE